MNNINEINDMAKTMKNVFPMTVNKVDNIGTTILDWVDNVLLYSLKKASMEYKTKIENFKIDLKNKIINMPKERIVAPKISIIGPTLEALKYTIEEKELREMFSNLLIASMDKEKKDNIHPSFIEVIKQMDSYDAILFVKIYKFVENIPAIMPTLSVPEKKMYVPSALPMWYFNCIENNDIFKSSACLLHLKKLGIIDLRENETISNVSYNDLINAKELVNILNDYENEYPNEKFEIKTKKCAIVINEYGRQFAKICCE